MLLYGTKSKPWGLIGLHFRTYGWFTKVDKIWKEKKKVSTITATCVMEEFICGEMPVTEDSMVPLI